MLIHRIKNDTHLLTFFAVFALFFTATSAADNCNAILSKLSVLGKHAPARPLALLSTQRFIRSRYT